MISWFEKHHKITLIIVIVIAMIIFYMSSLTFENYSQPKFSLNATLYHILAFFFFALFLSITFVKGRYRQFLSITAIFSILYGISDELHQFFIQGRSCTPKDVFLDTVGISLAIIFYWITIEYRFNSPLSRKMHKNNPSDSKKIQR